jgi:GC-rich sequence DNA-binding factor
MALLPVPTATLIPTLPTAISRLSSQLSNLTTSHATNTAALSTLASERLALEEKEVDMRKMVVNAEEKRAWFDGMRERMEGVAGFLDEKVRLIPIELFNSLIHW